MSGSVTASRPSRSSKSSARSRTRRGRHRKSSPRCIANGHYYASGRPTASWLSAALIVNDRNHFDAADQMYRESDE